MSKKATPIPRKVATKPVVQSSPTKKKEPGPCPTPTCSKSPPAAPRNSTTTLIGKEKKKVVKKTVKKCVIPGWHNKALVKESRNMLYEIERESQKPSVKETILRYALPVTTGVWFNNWCIHEQYARDPICRFPRGAVFPYQKELVTKYLHTKVELATYTSYVKYNMPVQIITNSEYVVSNRIQEVTSNLVLSALITEKAILHISKPYVIENGSQVTLSHHLCRIRRNVFCFIKRQKDKSLPVVETKPQRGPVKYNETLFIRLFKRDVNTPVYIRCERCDPKTPGPSYSHKMLLTMTDKPDRNCEFQIHSLLDLNRKLKVHDNVPTFDSILIYHPITNRYLTIDTTSVHASLIIGKEIKAFCRTTKDGHLRITTKNHFTIHTREEKEDVQVKGVPS